MNSPERIAIETPAGILAAVAHLPERTPCSVVVCSHGLLSSKDSSKFVSIGEALSGAGTAAVRFDFSGCGESRTAAAADLLGTRTRDLLQVLDYVQRQPWANGRIGLLGSSLGGLVSLLAAAFHGHGVGAVVCWATPFDLHRLERALAESGALQRCFPDVSSLGSPLDLSALSNIGGVFVIHGRDDDVVPWSDAVAIYRGVGEPRRLLIMEGADHRFLDPACRAFALKASLEWLRERGF